MKKEEVPSKSDDGQKQFFTDEYRHEGAFLINHKVQGSDEGQDDLELKTSVTQDKND